MLSKVQNPKMKFRKCQCFLLVQKKKRPKSFIKRANNLSASVTSRGQSALWHQPPHLTIPSIGMTWWFISCVGIMESWIHLWWSVSQYFFPGSRHHWYSPLAEDMVSLTSRYGFPSSRHKNQGADKRTTGISAGPRGSFDPWPHGMVYSTRLQKIRENQAKFYSLHPRFQGWESIF